MIKLQGNFSEWTRRAKLEKRKANPSQAKIKYCLQRAYFDSDDLAESFFNYSCDVAGRKKDGLVKDRRYDFALFMQKPGRYKMVQASRGSWKSSLCIVDYATWSIARDFFLNHESRERILLAREVQDLARRNSRWIMMQMQKSEYKYLSGDHRDRGRLNTLPWGVHEMMSKFRSDPTIGDPTLMPMGSTTERTGFHFDKILCDDLEAQRSSATRDMIENIWDFYRLLHSILDPKGQMIIACTRWHEDDIYRRIEKENEHLSLDEQFQIITIPACNEDFTGLNFPNVINEKQLRSIKKKQGSLIFSCQYLLNPMPDDARVFKAEYIKVWTPQMLNQARLHVYTTADFAFTEVRKSDFRRGTAKYDYTVIITVAIDEQWNYIVLDHFREKCSPHTGITELYRQWEQHKAMLSIVQKYDVRGVGESIDQVGYELGKQMPIDYVAYPPAGGKEGRIRELVQPRFEDKKVYLHPTMVKWFAEEEMLDFPKAKYDDCLDAICNVIRFGKPPPRVRIMSQLTKEQKEIEMLKAGVDPMESEDDWMYV